MAIGTDICCLGCGSLLVAPVRTELINGPKITELTGNGPRSRLSNPPDHDGIEVVVHLQCAECRAVTRFSFLHLDGRTVLYTGKAPTKDKLPVLAKQKERK